ncbi:MAG TPA: helix-turn-helix domain-containing protein [Rhodanobacteraceae bacterium]|nr:helix-turn-helix domain-containing protein [Rhodanobacteraceae bacterium]
MNTTSKPERTRLSAEDWERGALELIADEGVGAMAVEALARRLGVTKGSFYWHFRNRGALLEAALQRWEEHDEAEVLAKIEPIADPRLRLRAMFDFVARELPSHRIYAALLKALDHPAVLALMARVSARRMDFLAAAYREAGMNPAQAQHRARLTYAAYVGFMQINMTLGLPRLSHEEFDAYVDHVTDTLVP